MARVLDGGGFVEEAQTAAREAALLLGKICAIQQNFPEPKDLGKLLKPPVSCNWPTEVAGWLGNASADSEWKATATLDLLAAHLAERIGG